jgi:hypothetical protein
MHGRLAESRSAKQEKGGKAVTLHGSRIVRAATSAPSTTRAPELIQNLGVHWILQR